MKPMFAFVTVALTAASAATKYNVTLFQPAFVYGIGLKPGDDKANVEGDKAVFKRGKTLSEAPVRAQDTGENTRTNTTRYIQGARLREIRLGGTRAKLVFEGSGSTGSPAGSR
jgi:hypothetical protein